MIKTQQHMTARVVYVTAGDSLKDAYDLMRSLSIRHIPVLDHNRVVIGMLSDRDVLLHASKIKGRILVADIKVSDVMKTPVITCHDDTSIGAAADLMLQNQINALPVLDEENRLAGIVTSSDLLRILRNRSFEVSDRLLRFLNYPLLTVLPRDAAQA